MPFIRVNIVMLNVTKAILISGTYYTYVWNVVWIKWFINTLVWDPTTQIITLSDSWKKLILSNSEKIGKITLIRLFVKNLTTLRKKNVHFW